MSTTTRSRQKSPGTISPTDVSLAHLPVVDIDDADLEYANRLATERNASYESIDGGDVFGENTALTSHQIGLLGELAIARWYDATFDSDAYQFGDSGYDLTLWGNTVDVKTTATDAMRRPELLVRADTDVTADLYVLAHIIERDAHTARVRLFGYAPQEQVIERAPRKHPGQTENYVVSPSELTLLPGLQTSP